MRGFFCADMGVAYYIRIMQRRYAVVHITLEHLVC